MHSSPDFKSTNPSQEVLDFINRIEKADPNSPDFSADNSNETWGHYQFTGGSLTCRSVLKSWDCIGNTETARRLIAAAIKTCKVARHICFHRGVTPTGGYLSDIYLDQTIEIIWSLWKEAGGVRKFYFMQIQVHIFIVYSSRWLKGKRKQHRKRVEVTMLYFLPKRALLKIDRTAGGQNDDKRSGLDQGQFLLDKLN